MLEIPLKMSLRIAYPLSSTFLDFPDDESEAVVVYIMGCDRLCDNCHNPSFRDYKNPDAFEVLVERLFFLIQKECNRRNTNKVVLSGGDPLATQNIEATKRLLKILNDFGSFNVAIYTGYDINYVMQNQIQWFEFIKCGSYKEDLKQQPEKTDNYIRFASSNQKLYDKSYRLLSKDGIYYFNGGE